VKKASFFFLPGKIRAIERGEGKEEEEKEKTRGKEGRGKKAARKKLS
jgi:hypothetical protein